MNYYSIGEIAPLSEEIKHLDTATYAKALARFRVATVEVAVINSQNQLLLLKRKQDPGKGLWWVCGTKLIGPETIMEGAHRAVKNELGLEISLGRFIDLNLSQCINWAPSETAPYGEFNQHNIVAVKISDEEEKIISVRDVEHQDWKFVDIETLSSEYLEPLREITTCIKGC